MKEEGRKEGCEDCPCGNARWPHPPCAERRLSYLCNGSHLVLVDGRLLLEVVVPDVDDAVGSGEEEDAGPRGRPAAALEEAGRHSGAGVVGRE